MLASEHAVGDSGVLACLLRQLFIAEVHPAEVVVPSEPILENHSDGLLVHVGVHLHQTYQYRLRSSLEVEVVDCTVIDAGKEARD